jgi:glyoxylase-like metal-dependent hydrolase (beta-lactamase superfamily II)/rhodanese-related sulfurtransferase
MNVIPFVHEGLGNSSYLVQLTPDSALLVDPDRSIGRYLREAEVRGLRIIGVLETHLHADFITGSRELLDVTGVEPHASRAGEVRFQHHGVDPGDSLTIEGVRVRVIGSPGHTPEHVSYVLETPRDEPPVLFSGGSLIVGGAARTDLVSPDLTERLTRDQYSTLKLAFADLPDETLLYPTHGGGSFCSAGASGERTSTLGRERATNPLLRLEDEDEFTRWFPTTFPGAPTYFFKMRPINQAGPRLRRVIVDPPALSPEEFHAASETALIVDARPMDEYLQAHIPGSLSIAFRPSFATWLGWLVELDTPLLFVTGNEPLGRIVEESLLVGQENFAGWLAGGIAAWESAGLPLREMRSVGSDEARRLLKNGALALDVREPSEFTLGHLDGATNIPLGLIATSGEISEDRPIVTYCGHGERSTTAVSILERRGVDAVNLEGGFEAWKDAGSARTRQTR